MGHVEFMGEIRNEYNIVVGKLKHRWKDNTRMDFRKIGWGGGECMNLAQDRDK
jgi:hypothetical protein